MDYVSTKELAERWGMSTSRIVRLAKAGRIKGAQLVGKSWLFPTDAQRPSDNRRKENKALLHGQGLESDLAQNDGFRFPLYLYCNYSAEEIENDFTNDERTLYQGELLCYRGKYQESGEILKRLLQNTNNRYVRYGALYYLCIGSIYRRCCKEALSYYHELALLVLEEARHKTELEFLIRDLETYFIGNRYYLEEFSLDMHVVFPPHMREYLLLECAYSDLLKTRFEGAQVSLDSYELLLQTEQNHFSALSAISMHVYLAIICKTCARKERSIFHVREACRIAQDHDMEYSIVSVMIQYALDTYQEALGDWDPAQLIRLKAINDDTSAAFRLLLDYAHKHGMLQLLNMNDIRLISLVEKGFTNKEIAASLNLSVNTVSKRISALLEKTGTHSKKELASKFRETMRDYRPQTDR